MHSLTSKAMWKLAVEAGGREEVSVTVSRQCTHVCHLTPWTQEQQEVGVSYRTLLCLPWTELFLLMIVVLKP